MKKESSKEPMKTPSKTLWGIFKNRIVDAMFSRKFLALLVACAAFFLTGKFPAAYLVAVIGMYCGFNTLESVVYDFTRGKKGGEE